uniref:AlNc14C103G6106 protein n=1 Tax=Albugo laibachii Nc14 TaxID=890382 RepID=F0WHP9_9STRA|nr:AlNc14C103G6106 [Albugo laibachii Nc14]CCA23720.1 AlNc14C204G8770 [Albugo laibachii Nc14]|eukprot:CCA23720.1 AlNc14C204G8770 [Albugo laibachii Nc14]
MPPELLNYKIKEKIKKNKCDALPYQEHSQHSTHLRLFEILSEFNTLTYILSSDLIPKLPTLLHQARPSNKSRIMHRVRLLVIQLSVWSLYSVTFSKLVLQKYFYRRSALSHFKPEIRLI